MSTSPLKVFYDTYGFVVLRNCGFNDQIEALRADYDGFFEQEYGEDWFVKPRQPIINRLQSFKRFHDVIGKTKLLGFVDMLLGNDWTFMGLDYSVFLGGSGSNAHRDSFPSFSQLKAAIYLQDSNFSEGGVFQVIPGSHRFHDSFGHETGIGLRWPNGSGFDSQMISDVNCGRNLPVFSGIMKLPFVSIELSVGDIMLFDNRIIHQVTSSKFPIRRLIAMNFFEGFSSYSRKYTGGTIYDYVNVVLGNYFDSSCIIEKHFGRVIPALDLNEDEINVRRLYDRYYPRVRSNFINPQGSFTNSKELIEYCYKGIQGKNLWSFKQI